MNDEAGGGKAGLMAGANTVDTGWKSDYYLGDSQWERGSGERSWEIGDNKV